MPFTEESKIKRYESTANTIEKRAKREWAEAKNGGPGYQYASARKDFEKAKELREKAALLKKKNRGGR